MDPCTRNPPGTTLDPLAQLLAPFEVQALDADPSTIYALTRDGTIAWTNRAWHRFARDNGARWSPGEWGPGASLEDAIPGALRPFYAELLERARRSSEPVEHDYACSSPTVHRMFRMRLLPCASGALVVVNAPLRTSPVEASHDPADVAPYVGADGIVVQCSHCRRVRRAGGGDAWDWVPGFVASLPPLSVSHGLCNICFHYHYPDA